MKNIFHIILIIIFIATCNEEEHKSVKVETRGATGITNTEATCWGIIIEQGNGIKEYGIEISGVRIPHTITKADSFGVHVNNLEDGRNYSYKAYAIGNNEDILYGKIQSFQSLIPPGISLSIKNITSQSADIEYVNNPEQLREWGLYYKANDTATTKDIKVEAKGERIIRLTGLDPYTEYWLLTYATDKKGASATSNWNHFFTKCVQPRLSKPVSSGITLSGATISFEIEYVGGGNQAVISECGMQYSTDRQTWTKKAIPFAEGTLTYALTGLKPATKYYIHAYARNNGSIEGYSDTLEITTAGAVPTLASPNVTALKSYKTSMTGGKVTNDGQLSVTEYGFCWSTVPGRAAATGSNYKKITTGSKDAFEYLSFDLLANTKYYIRAYARNEAGVGYSEEISINIPNPQYGEFTDKRDNKKYKTVTIGNQEWMAEDLDFEYIWSYIDGTTKKRIYTVPYKYPFSITDIVSPEGWHIPTISEVETMIAEIGGANNNSPISKRGINTTGLGIDKYFWTSTIENPDIMVHIGAFFLNYQGITRLWIFTGESRPDYYPVRCIKNK